MFIGSALILQKISHSISVDPYRDMESDGYLRSYTKVRTKFWITLLDYAIQEFYGTDWNLMFSLGLYT